MIMKKEILLTGLVLFILLSGYLFTYLVYTRFYNYYGFVFGKSDIDNYLIREDNLFLEPDLVHITFVSIITILSLLFYNNISECLTYLIPFIMWFVIPVLIFMHTLSFFNNKRFIHLAIIGIIFYLFGTFILFYIGVVSIYAQSFSLLFFILSFIIQNYAIHTQNISRKIILCILWFLTICFSLSLHIYTIIPLLIILISVNLNYKNLILFILIFSIIGFLFFDLIDYTIFNNNYYDEPSLYEILFLFTNPILYVLSFIGIINYTNKTKQYFILLFISGIIVHNARLLIFFHPFLILFSLIGYDKLCNRYNKIIVTLAILICIFLWFGYVYQLFIQSMIIEFSSSKEVYGREILDNYGLLNSLFIKR